MNRIGGRCRQEAPAGPGVKVGMGGPPPRRVGEGCGEDQVCHKRPIVPSIGATPHWVGGCDGRRASGRWSSAARWASRFSGISLSCRGCVDQPATCGVCPVAVGDCPRRGRGGGRRAQLLKGEGVRVDALSNRPRPLMLDEDLVGQGVQVVVDGGGAEVRGQVRARSIYMTSGRAKELLMGGPCVRRRRGETCPVFRAGGRWAVSWSRVCMGALLGAGGEM